MGGEWGGRGRGSENEGGGGKNKVVERDKSREK